MQKSEFISYTEVLKEKENTKKGLIPNKDRK